MAAGGHGPLRPRLIGLYGLLASLNIGAWLVAAFVFQRHPALLGVGLLVFGLGLRHAVDADHIAAIDNVTRKLLRDGQRPIAVGFFFALGHASVVTLIAAIVATAAALLPRIEGLREVGGLISGSISTIFLLAIAGLNIAIFRSVWSTYRMAKRGHTVVETDLDVLLGSRRLIARLLKPMLGLISRSWHMAPLGFIFGLGFDTATEVTLFSLSASQAANGIPVAALLVFPLLFAAAMILVDTTDGVLMLGAYEWALVRPLRKLTYNMAITLASAVIALITGGAQLVSLVGQWLALPQQSWGWAARICASFNQLGMIVIAVFLILWLTTHLLHRRSDGRAVTDLRSVARRPL